MIAKSTEENHSLIAREQSVWKRDWKFVTRFKLYSGLKVHTSRALIVKTAAGRYLTRGKRCQNVHTSPNWYKIREKTSIQDFLLRDQDYTGSNECLAIELPNCLSAVIPCL